MIIESLSLRHIPFVSNRPPKDVRLATDKPLLPLPFAIRTLRTFYVRRVYICTRPIRTQRHEFLWPVGLAAKLPVIVALESNGILPQSL